MRSISLFAIACLSMVALFELFLSSAGILAPIVQIDPTKGERYFPDKTCSSLFVTEGFGLARTNSAGWFGKEFVDHGPSDISVAVVGNSYVASRQVFYRDNFLSVAEGSLNAGSLGPTYSFFNFGKEAMPLTELLFVKEEVASTYHPDHILVLINDHSFSASPRLVPYYKMVNDSLHLDLSFRNSPVVELYDKLKAISGSSLLFLGYRVKNKMPQLGEILFDKFHFPFSKPLEQEGHDLSVADIDRTVLETLRKDDRVIFLLDLEPNESDQIRPLISGSHVIDLRPALTRMKVEQGIDPNYWKISNTEGHWTIPAHKVIAREISNNLPRMVANKQTADPPENAPGAN